MTFRETEFHSGLGLAGAGESVEGVAEGGEDEEEGLDPGDLEQFQDALVDAGEGDAVSGFLAGDVGADQRAQSGGVDVGNVGQIENDGWGIFHADGAVKQVQVFRDQRAFQEEHALSLDCARVAFDD